MGIITAAFMTGIAALPAGSSSAIAPAARTLTVTSYEYALQAADTVQSGVVTVRLVNRGKEGHQVVLARLDDTTSLSRAMRTLVDDKVRTTGIRWMGGVENAIPGHVSETTLVLPAGRYLILCGYDGPNGLAHQSMGMIRPLVVTPAAGSSRNALPPASVTARLTDYHIALSGPLHPGPRLMRVENDGAHRHHLFIVRIVGAATLAEIAKWDGKSEPHPVEDIGAGAGALDPGEASVIHLTLTPGRYLFGCLLSDSAKAPPHYKLGMAAEVAVK